MKRNVFKRSLGLILTVALSILSLSVFAACTTGEKVLVSGSSSVSPLLSKLAAAYEKENKGVRIMITTSESTVGITDTVDEKNDIGMASRDLKASETGLVSTKICDDGVVIIVNNFNEITNVTSAEIYELYANGTAIGAVNSAISREEGSGTRDAFDGLIKNAEGKKLSEVTSFSSVVSIQNNTGAVMTEITSTENKIGYVSLGSLNDTVKSLTFDGIAATAENVKNKSYKLARPFNLVTKEGKELSAAAKSFIEFVLSEAGQKIVADSGYVAL